jgi:hypothetical protein
MEGLKVAWRKLYGELGDPGLLDENRCWTPKITAIIKAILNQPKFL